MEQKVVLLLHLVFSKLQTWILQSYRYKTPHISLITWSTTTLTTTTTVVACNLYTLAFIIIPCSCHYLQSSFFAFHFKVTQVIKRRKTVWEKNWSDEMHAYRTYCAVRTQNCESSIILCILFTHMYYTHQFFLGKRFELKILFTEERMSPYAKYLLP